MPTRKRGGIIEQSWSHTLQGRRYRGGGGGGQGGLKHPHFL